MPDLQFAHVWPLVFSILAFALLISGIDDLVPALICLLHRLKGVSPARPPSEAIPIQHRARSIAIFVPCWKEASVLGNMVRHNLGAIRYRNFDFFLGVYPNDPATTEVAESLAAAYTNVHVAVCAHPGPTSKADCLNWIYREMCRYEERQGVLFDTVVLHDAEDLIHPQAFEVINQERTRHAMVQIPVLPLATALGEITHGVYCDDFAEYQVIDMPARRWSGSFIPSNGVGTAFAREILQALSAERGGHVFEPDCLTEDYQIGVTIHQLGYSQTFTCLESDTHHNFIATREYFPRRFKSAVRQRTRWVMGNALQSWERNGWHGTWLTKYWFWRDRKGLAASPLSLLTNLLFLWGTTDWIVSRLTDRAWSFAVTDPSVLTLCTLTLALQCWRLLLRMACVAHVFGPAFALGVPIRSFHANLINCLAASQAMWRYVAARRKGRTLAWLKTDHAYPSLEALRSHRKDLAEVLEQGSYVSDSTLALAKAMLPPGGDLAEFLSSLGLISDRDLCHAIGLQSGVSAGEVDVEDMNPAIARSLPAHVQRKYSIVPFRLHGGRLLVAGPRVPEVDLFEELKPFTRMTVEFKLVTPNNYQDLLAAV